MTRRFGSMRSPSVMTSILRGDEAVLSVGQSVGDTYLWIGRRIDGPLAGEADHLVFAGTPGGRVNANDRRRRLFRAPSGTSSHAGDAVVGLGVKADVIASDAWLAPVSFHHFDLRVGNFSGKISEEVEPFTFDFFALFGPRLFRRCFSCFGCRCCCLRGICTERSGRPREGGNPQTQSLPSRCFTMIFHGLRVSL